MANESVQAKVTESKSRSVRTNRFKPSAPAGFVRPKPVPVPAKSK